MKRTLACFATFAILIAGCTTAGSAPSQAANATPAGSATNAAQSPGASSAAQTPDATAAQPAGAKPVTISGKGISKSKPFQLSGDYLVTWSAKADTKIGCYNGASLARKDGTFMFETLVNEMFSDSSKHTGSTNLYTMDDAQYYVDASSGCAWSFTFTPS